jgi:hypothetical protein
MILKESIASRNAPERPIGVAPARLSAVSAITSVVEAATMSAILKK